MADLIESIKNISIAVFEASKFSTPMFGKVTSSSPLQIQVEQKMTLTATQLVLTRNVTEHAIEMTVAHETDKDAFMDAEHTHIAGDSTTDEGNLDTAHKHEYKGLKVFTVHQGLTTGEQVLLIRMRGGQKFIVWDRIGAFTESEKHGKPKSDIIDLPEEDIPLGNIHQKGGFQTLTEATLTFIKEYIGQADEKGKTYYTGICVDTGEWGVTKVTYCYELYKNMLPSETAIEMNSFSKETTQAFVFTDDTPLRWETEYKNATLRHYELMIDRQVLIVYYVKDGVVYCWHWKDEKDAVPATFLCSLDELLAERSGYSSYDLGGVTFHIYTLNPKYDNLRLRHIVDKVSNVAGNNTLFMINASFFGGFNAKNTSLHYVGYGMSDNGYVHNKIDKGTEDYEHMKTLIYFNDGSYKLEYYKNLDPSEVENDSKIAKFIITGLDSNHTVGNAANRARAGMGIKENGEMVFIACEENPGTKAPTIETELKKLGATGKLMLDGGGSTSFYAQGEMKVNAEDRNVASVFEVYK